MDRLTIRLVGDPRQPQHDSYGRKVPIWEVTKERTVCGGKDGFGKQSSSKSYFTRKDSSSSTIFSIYDDKQPHNGSTAEEKLSWRSWIPLPMWWEWKKPTSQDSYSMSPYSTMETHWKPFTLKLPLLGCITLVSVGLIAVLEVLSHMSAGDNGGGLSFAPTVDDLSTTAIAGYLYLPTVIAVLYSMMWSWVDLDVKRLEPWFQLSKPEGAVAEESLLLQYPFDFLAFVPLRAARRRHWAVFIAGSTMVFITWAIVPLQSAIFSTGIVTRSRLVPMTISQTLMPAANQTMSLTSRFFNTAYGVSWLEQKLPPFTTTEYALLPFQPEVSTFNITTTETWTGATHMFYTNLTCKPGRIVGQGESHSWTAEGIPVNSTHFGDDDGCVIANHDIFNFDKIGQMVTYTQGGRYSPNCSDGENIHKYFALASNSRSTDGTGRYSNFTILFCTPTYHVRNVTATVNATTRAVVQVDYDKAEPPQPVTNGVFNITNFEYMIGEGKSFVQREGNVTDTSIVQQTPKLYERNITWPSSAMVGYAVAMSNMDRTELNDPLKFGQALELAHKLLFSTAITQLLVPSSESDGSLYGGFQSSAEGIRRDSPGSIVLVRSFAIVVEVCLGLVGVLTCSLWLYYRQRHSSMVSDPGSISDVMQLVRSSRKLLHDFNDNGTITNKALEERLQGQRFRLSTSVVNGLATMKLQADGKDGLAYTEAVPARAETGIDCPEQFQAVRPLELKYPIGIMITLVIACAMAILIALYMRILADNGLQRPSNNETVLLILTNLIPTAFATLLEPLWIVLNRLLCVLQPFDDLRAGNAAPGATVKARYTSLPPQLTFWRALRSRHFLLAIVCAVAMSTNVLAVALSALFKDLPTSVLVPIASKTRFTPALNGTPDFFANSVDGTRVPILDQYYAAVANLSGEALLPPWVDNNYWFMPFELPSAATLNATMVNSQVSGYIATTRGLGYDMKCWDTRSSVNGDILTFERYPGSPPTLPEPQTEWTFSVSHNLPDGKNITCGQYKFASKNGTEIFLDAFFPARASMEIIASMGLNNDTNGVSWSGRVGQFRMPPPDDGYCASMFVAGWLRMAEASMTEPQAATNTLENRQEASGKAVNPNVESEPSLIDEWLTANTNETEAATGTATVPATTSPVVERRSIDSVFMQCVPKLRSAMFNVSVDKNGRILSSNRTSEFETDMEIFGGDQAVRDLTVQVNQLVAVITDDTYRFWHNDTALADWFNTALALKMNTVALVDPSLPLPDITEITPAVVEVYRLISAILLSQNSKSFATASDDSSVTLAAVTTQQRIFMEPVMFFTAVALLGLQLLTLIAYYAWRPRRFLPRMPLTIASIIAYVSASHATQQVHLKPSEMRYAYGRFRGVDGHTHVGIEVAPLVVPLKAENPDFKRRRRSRWLRREQDPAQPKVWI